MNPLSIDDFRLFILLVISTDGYENLSQLVKKLQATFDLEINQTRIEKLTVKWRNLDLIDDEYRINKNGWSNQEIYDRKVIKDLFRFLENSSFKKFFKRNPKKVLNMLMLDDKTKCYSNKYFPKMEYSTPEEIKDIKEGLKKIL